MEGGKDWWDQILEALKQVEYMVLVMTQASLASLIVRKEWRQARQEGVGVIPVFGQSNLDLSQLPRWMRDVHWVNTDVPEQWTRFLRTLESPHERTRVPFMADDLPAGYVPRLKEFEELAGSLLDPEQENPIAITAALKGAGGYGKTTLAKALCHDERIQEAFYDGILWVTLGEQLNVMAGLTKLYAALTEERPNFVDEEEASIKLAEVLGDKACLMVIDDVWNAAHLRPFLRGGKRCARIITTRDSTTLPETARLRVPVDAMHQQEALALLSYDLPKGEIEAIRALATRLGEWPFLLKLANGVLRERVNTMGQPLSAALAYVQKALEKRGLTAFDARNPVERHQAVAITLGTSFEHLKKDELARYQEMAIFPEDVEIPLAAVTKLWTVTGGLDDFDTEELCTRLSQLSLLLRYDLTTQRIQLHDVVRTYLEEQVPSQLPILHGQFLDAYELQYEPVKSARDPYLCRYLAYHLVKAERWDELKKLLLNVEWLYAKLEVVDLTSLLSDFDWVQGDKALELVQGAIRLAAHVLGKDRAQLFSQLLGRLQTLQLPEIQKLVNQAKRWTKNLWLRPLQGSLIASGGPLIRTLSGHSDSVNAVAVTPDGTRVISAAGDSTCKVWDLATGQEVFTLSGHGGWMRAVAVTPDGTRVISASVDETCKVWDLSTGQEVFTLSGHSGMVNAVAVTGDGTRAISGGDDSTCKVWDLATGQEVFTLSGHSGNVNALAVTADGTRAISGGDDSTCKVWDLATGQEIFTLSGHSDNVNALAVTADGTRVISAAGDSTCKVWDLATGREVFTLSGHSDRVNAVAVTGDGTRAISGGDDSTCKVWDLSAGEMLYTLRGHSDNVTALAVTGDGTRVISAAGDSTCKVWDLATGQEVFTLSGHGAWVRAVAVTADGMRVISASADETCKLWDLSTEQEVQTFSGHRGWVNAVAVTGDGTRAISGGDDGWCKVWDLATGQEVFTLSGHSDNVNALAVTADGTRVISAAGDSTCKVWDLATGQEIFTLSGHSDRVNAVAVTGDGTRAISGGDDSTCKVWDLSTGEMLYTLRGHSDNVTALAVTGDGTRVISGGNDGRCIVWDLATGQEVFTLSGHSDNVNALAVTPDGTRVISGGDVGICIVWDLSTGKKVHTLREHNDNGLAVAVAVTGDGTRVISASVIQTCKVWDLATGREVQTLIGHGGWVRAVAVTGNGTRAISAEDETCKVWDLASGEVVATFTGESPISCCAVSPDCQTIIIGEYSGRVHFLRLEGID